MGYRGNVVSFQKKEGRQSKAPRGSRTICKFLGSIRENIAHHPQYREHHSSSNPRTSSPRNREARLASLSFESLSRCCSLSSVDALATTMRCPRRHAQLQMFLLNFVGIFSGRTVDSGYFQHSLAIGCTLQVLGVFTTAFSTKYWQLFLAQGVCSGLGHGFLFAPTVSILPTYFKRNRAFAVALATCGAATGGIVFPTIAYACMSRLGFRWTVLIMGFVITINATIIFSFTKTRIAVRKPRSLFNMSAFTELSYTLFAIGSFLSLWGLYFAYFYVSLLLHSMI